MACNPDLFFIPVELGYIAYAPLRGLAIKLTEEEYDNLELREEVMRRAGFMTTCAPTPAISGATPFQLVDADFLTIGLTNACNLRCSYCYADGGEHSDVMSKELLDAVIREAQRHFDKHKRLNVCFMGDGETLVAKELFFEACQRLREITPKVFIQLITNGTLLTREVVRQLKEWNVDVQISYDPLCDSRPTVTGAPSTNMVHEAFKLLAEFEIPFFARATVLPETTHLMPEGVRYLKSVAPTLRGMMYEPVGVCDRTSSSYDPGVFIQHFMESVKVAEELGIYLNSGGYRRGGVKVSPSYCGTCIPSVNITPQGYLSACNRAMRVEQTNANRYIFGKFNPDTQEFDLFQDKIADLQTSTVVDAYPECASCAAKWHCGGGCPMKRDFDEDICTLNYTLFVHQLSRGIDEKQFRNLRPQLSIFRTETTGGVRFDMRAVHAPVAEFALADFAYTTCGGW